MHEVETHGLVAGEVVYDHLALRTARVERVAPDEVALVDAGKTTRWSARGLYRLALERLAPPSELILALEQPDPTARRAALSALDPVARAAALCRGRRTGPCRTRAERLDDVFVAEAVTRRELLRAHEEALGAPGERFVDDVLARVASGEGAALLRADSTGLRLVVDAPTWLLERLSLDRTWRRERGRGDRRAACEPAGVAPLVREDASSQAPYTSDEEAALAWALGEIARIERGHDLEPVDGARLGELRSRFWAVFRRSVVLKTARRLDPDRGWIDPETVPEEVFERLLEHLRGGNGAPAAVERLRRHLAAERDLAAAPAPTSQLVRNALYGCVDALRAARQHTAPRHVALDPGLHEQGALRPSEGAPPGLRELGFAELRELLAEAAPHDVVEQRRRADQLLRAIRRVFVRELDALRARDPVRYRTVLLDFTTLLSRPRIADYTGINYDTFRWWFPRAGARATRPPRFVRAFLPDELQRFVSRFGRVFPVLQLGLLPRPHEIDAIVDDEDAREALLDLFTYAPLDGRGEFWGDDVLARAAARTGRSVEAFIDDTLFPFLVTLVEHRRDQDLQRGRPADAAPGDPLDLEVGALALLLLGPPDGRGLRAWLSTRAEALPDARRELARAAGLSPLALVDLELGRRWATPAELAALRALAPDLPAAVLDGLAPDLGPELVGALGAADEELA